MSFGRLLFECLLSIVPYWRVSDDAWPLSDGSHRTGVGVLRNYGGDLLVVPCELRDPQFPETARQLHLAASSDIGRRVVAMVDDRSDGAWNDPQGQITVADVTRWTDRDTLKILVDPRVLEDEAPL